MHKLSFGFFSFVFALLSVDPCVSAASDSDKNAAMQGYMSCLIGAAEKFDDHTSDADSVATGIEGLCVGEMQNAINVFGDGLSFDAYQTLKAKIEGMSLTIATSVVLKERALRASAPR